MNTNGDPTTQTNPVNPALADSQPGSSTGTNGSVSTKEQQPSSSVDVGALIEKYEQRHRALMSEKDKMANERDKAIAAQVELQKQLTSLQEQSSTALNGAAQTTQSAIDQAKTLAEKIALLEAENTKASLLLQKPELAAYADLIPAHADPEKVKATIAKLEEVNRAQLAKYQPPQQQQQQGQMPNILDLYANRPGMAPFLNGVPGSVLPGSPPGSNPAQMASMGSMGDQNKAIEAKLKAAQDSGDPAQFQAALEEAKATADLMIRNVMGGSS